MEDHSGYNNATFEMKEVDLSEIGEHYQIPRVELSKSHQAENNGIGPPEYLPNKRDAVISSIEDGRFRSNSFPPSHVESKYRNNSVPESAEEDYSLLSFFNKDGGLGRLIQSFKRNNHNFKRASKILATLLALGAYISYFFAVLIIKTDSENENYWCNSDGLLITITSISLIMFIYFWVLKPFFWRNKPDICIGKKNMEKISKFCNHRFTSLSLYMVFIGGIIIFLIFDTVDERSRLISALGILVFIIFGFLFSTAPRKIVWRQVIWGIGLQFVLGLIILRWPPGREIFQCLGDKVKTFLLFTDHGSSFIFGSLVSEGIIAFKILSVILFLSFVIQILYYYGVMQWFVFNAGWLLQITVGTTACESVNAAANVFLGMSEAPLVIKPYLSLMTNSELHAVMTGGFATIAGSVLAAYISFGVNSAHLLSASVMSAPAALAFSKLFYPEVELSRTTASDLQKLDCTESNVLHAALEGVSASISLIANIVGNLIAFIAFIAFIDALLSWPCDLVGIADGTCTLSNLLGNICTPIAFIMGVPLVDCYSVGQLIGTKTIVNEFVAYLKLGEFIKDSVISQRSITISTYALCGFSNIASIGIQLGSLGALVPERKGDLSKIVVRAMIAGTIACFSTACVAGTLISSDSYPQPKIPEI